MFDTHPAHPATLLSKTMSKLVYRENRRNMLPSSSIMTVIPKPEKRNRLVCLSGAKSDLNLKI